MDWRWDRCALVLAMLAAACGGSDTSGRVPEGPADSSSSALAGEVLVSAAASLTEAFTDLEEAFEAAHPGVDIVLNLAGSSSLQTQILEGVPADVFAAASVETVQRIVDAGGVVGEPRVFARNALQIAVPAGNPAGVGGVEDFARGALRVGLCAEQVPCGALAREALARRGVRVAVDTNEPNVRALLTKIELGELDAGITYRTDVVAAGGAVEGIDLPEEATVAATYPIVVLAGAPNPVAADALVRFVLSEEGRRILVGRGFSTP